MFWSTETVKQIINKAIISVIFLIYYYLRRCKNLKSNLLKSVF